MPINATENDIKSFFGGIDILEIKFDQNEKD